MRPGLARFGLGAQAGDLARFFVFHRWLLVPARVGRSSWVFNAIAGRA
ncbi:MAG: hypothetical protein ABIF71_01725 [Planctomycetota bacterium]